MSHLSSTAPSLQEDGSLSILGASLSGPYALSPLRSGAGLSSSSSGSSSSLTSPASRSGEAAAGAFNTLMALEPANAAALGGTRSVAQLPEELASIMLSYLQLPQLILCSRVQRQWRDLSAADEFWRPLYSINYGDSMRLNEQQSWKFNFRARDLMLSQLGPAISMLAHPERERRVESVAFLRSHCEFLRFMLDPPVIAPLPLPTMPLAQAQAAAAAVAGAVPVATAVPHDAADALPMAVAVPRQAQGAADLPAAVAMPMDAAAAGTTVAAPAPDPELARMYSRPPRPPPTFSPSARPALPARGSVEFEHAQQLVLDALVNQGWRKLWPLLSAGEDPADGGRSAVPPQPTPVVQSSADATALPHASSIFNFLPASAASATDAAQSTPAASASASPTDDSMDMSSPDAAAAAASSSPSPTRSSLFDDADSYSADDASYVSPFPHADRSLEWGAVLVAWTEHPFLRFKAVSRAIDDIALLVQARMEQVVAEVAASAGDSSSSSSSASSAAAGSSSEPTIHTLPFHVRLQCLHHILYAELGFRGNDSSYYDVRNSFVHLVIRHRTGIPISLAVVYAAVATRLGIVVRGVNSPGHFLLRVEERTSVHHEREKAPAGSVASVAAALASSSLHSGAAAASSAASAGSSSSSASDSVYFVDAFSGQLMSASITLNFLSLFGGGAALAAAAAAGVSPRESSMLEPCSRAQIFVRMYRNLIGLYQHPRAQHHHAAPPASLTPSGPGRRDAQSAALYRMEARVHHCASAILALTRLSGGAEPDVTTAVFIDRFRYAGAMTR